MPLACLGLQQNALLLKKLLSICHAVDFTPILKNAFFVAEGYILASKSRSLLPGYAAQLVCDVLPISNLQKMYKAIYVRKDMVAHLGSFPFCI